MSETKITITPIALKNQKPTDIKECYIELFENHLHYKMEFYADEPKDTNDPELGWDKNVYNNLEIICIKKSIAGIEKSITANKKWRVCICVNGFGEDLKVYSRSQTAADSLYKQLSEWLLKQA